MDVGKITAEADNLHTSNRWRECYDYLKSYADSTDVELLWRLIRAYYFVGKHLARSKEEAKEIATKGQEIADRALGINDNHFNVHRWSGVFLSWSSEVWGMKNKIEKSFVIKEHFQKAIAIDGKDALVKHLLGRWCYEVASISWMNRQLARAIFAAPPVSSYEEALKYFKDAEETSPGFYTGNFLYLAKTYYKLSQNQEAKKWAEKVIEHRAENKDEEECLKEATELMKSL